MITPQYQAVLFDFDGVLCHDKFYNAALSPERADVCEWIKINIFGNKELCKKWMRGEISSFDVNELIAKNTTLPNDLLNRKFIESVRSMRLDEKIVRLARSLAENGVKIGIVTDNMDVFSSITVPKHNLKSLFDIIVNSSDHGLLKQDANGKLFDIALSALGVKIENTLHVDDSMHAVELFKKKGGDVFLYRDFKMLKEYLAP